jgi:hypothetical protein
LIDNVELAAAIGRIGMEAVSSGSAAAETLPATISGGRTLDPSPPSALAGPMNPSAAKPNPAIAIVLKHHPEHRP